MTDAATLLTLAERCEREEPSSMLDWAIIEGVEGDKPGIVRPFTSSLDAAVTLVPEGWVFELSQAIDTKPSFTAKVWRKGPETEIHANWGLYQKGSYHISMDDYLKALRWAGSAALALCAAALRARAAMEKA